MRISNTREATTLGLSAIPSRVKLYLGGALRQRLRAHRNSPTSVVAWNGARSAVEQPMPGAANSRYLPEATEQWMVTES
jgi:hypothetical protein